MSRIVDLNGRTLNTEARPERPVTKAQGGAIVTSEIDIAIERWNKIALKACNGDAEKAHIFEIKFERFQYSEAIKEKQGLFGYAELKIIITHQKEVKEIYRKGQSFKTERELDNTNAYFPALIIDCLGCLIASGLMYNLALLTNAESIVKEPENASKIKSSKPRANPKSKPGDGNTSGSSK